MRTIHAASCAVMERDTPPEWSATCSCGASSFSVAGDPFAFDVAGPTATLPISAYE